MIKFDPTTKSIQYVQTVELSNILDTITTIKEVCGGAYEAEEVADPGTLEDFLNWDHSNPTPNEETIDDLLSFVVDELKMAEDDDMDLSLFPAMRKAVIEWLCEQFDTDEIRNIINANDKEYFF